MSEEKELTFSIIQIGDSGVGKTSIFRRYVYNTFEDNTMSTIGLQFSFKDVTLDNNITLKLKLLDTAGQEKYKSLSKSFFRNAHAALFVFALNRMETFQHITEWVELFKENHDRVDKIPKYLIGNKSDLIKSREVDQKLIDDLENQLGFKYFPTSALNNYNIDALFKDIANTLYQAYKDDKNDKGQKSFKIKNKNKVVKSKCALCKENV